MRAASHAGLQTVRDMKSLANENRHTEKLGWLGRAIEVKAAVSQVRNDRERSRYDASAQSARVLLRSVIPQTSKGSR